MAKTKLISPHGSAELKVLLLEGKEREAELKRAQGLPMMVITSRETGDLIMLGIG
ncbi:MAG: sulfate adenylyltransferase, partial [candidate division Zixibacteria bacterium]|nr:sulfate adenylyltransferase [candidate division Zixibacteria bacterium]